MVSNTSMWMALLLKHVNTSLQRLAFAAPPRVFLVHTVQGPKASKPTFVNGGVGSVLRLTVPDRPDSHAAGAEVCGILACADVSPLARVRNLSDCLNTIGDVNMEFPAFVLVITKNNFGICVKCD